MTDLSRQSGDPSTRWRRYITSCLVALLVSSAASFAAGVSQLSSREPLAPLPQLPPMDEQKVELGKALFFDPILSGMNKLACSTCHDLTVGGTIRERRTVGYKGKVHRFNAPTVFNVANDSRLGWRGDFASIEEQNESAILDPNLMGADWTTVIGRLRDSEQYAQSFEDVYGKPPDREAVLDVLAVFQRSLSTPNSALDRYLKGDANALNAEELEGYRLFKEFGCASCHQGANVGGNMYQRFGIFASPGLRREPNDGDLGRFTLTKNPSDIGVFRVPSLRNVALTAPYFHDGSVDTLEEAVSIMAKSQLGRTLEPTEVEALVAFLKTLTGQYNGTQLETTSSPINN